MRIIDRTVRDCFAESAIVQQIMAVVDGDLVRDERRPSIDHFHDVATLPVGQGARPQWSRMNRSVLESDWSSRPKELLSRARSPVRRGKRR